MTTMRLSSHSLARKLLALPDYLVVFDGMGKHIAMVSDGPKFHNPYTGDWTPVHGSQFPVVVIELDDETDPI